MPELTIATLNLFNNEHGRWTDRAPLVHGQLVELAPDVLALQEVDARGDQVPALVERANRSIPGDPYIAVTMPNPNPDSIKSLAVVTRLPVTEVTMLDDIGGGDIALHVAVSVGAAELSVFTTHLHYGPSRRGGERRRRQVGRLLPWVEEVAAGRAHVLGGDFNSRPDGDTIGAVKARLRSAHEVANRREPHWTHPTPFVRSIDPMRAFGVPELPDGPGVAVDYLFVSEHVEVLSASVAFDRPSPTDPELYASDHLGVRARVRVH